jgi:hypothetical protein
MKTRGKKKRENFCQTGVEGKRVRKSRSSFLKHKKHFATLEGTQKKGGERDCSLFVTKE